MKSFPIFIKNPVNRIDPSQQHTEGIEGYYFEGKDDTQVAFWEYNLDRIAEKHIHEFDEYVICVSGQYTTILNDQEIVLKPGDELVIPKGVEHSGKAMAGTKTIFGFAGKRIKQ